MRSWLPAVARGQRVSVMQACEVRPSRLILDCMNQEAALAWDQHAPAYARLFEPLTGFIARAMLHMVESRLPPKAALLDIACGSGALAVPAARRALRERAATGVCSTIVATDFSAKMVELTRQAAAALGANEEIIRCEVHNGEALGLADATFDAVFSSFGIFLFNDRCAGWREAARVLRPGGTFVTSVWKGPQHNPMLREQLGPIMAALPPHLVPPSTGGWLEIREPEALIAEVTTSAPFTNARCYPFHATIAIGNWREFWDAMRDNPVIGGLLRRCSQTELAAVYASVSQRLRELAGGDDEPLLLESVCNILVATRL